MSNPGNMGFQPMPPRTMGFQPMSHANADDTANRHGLEAHATPNPHGQDVQDTNRHELEAHATFPSARRGFAFAIVLVLLIIGSAMVSWSLSRTGIQNRVVALQVQEYRRHHELLGLRDIIQHWLSDRDLKEQLTEITMAGGVAHQIVLPTGETISLLIHDGQGLALGVLAPGLSFEQQQQILDILALLPPDRPDLIRRSGPPQISITSAPEEVIHALAGQNFDLAQTIIDWRDIPRENPSNGELIDHLRSQGFSNEEINPLLTMMTFDPSLWRIDAEVQDEQGIRRYTLTALIHQTGGAIMLDAVAHPLGALFPPVSRPWDEEWPTTPLPYEGTLAEAESELLLPPSPPEEDGVGQDYLE